MGSPFHNAQAFLEDEWVAANSWARKLSVPNLHKKFYNARGAPLVSFRFSTENSWRQVNPKWKAMTNANKGVVVTRFLKEGSGAPQRGLLRRAGRAIAHRVAPRTVSAYNAVRKNGNTARRVRDTMSALGTNKLAYIFNSKHVENFVKAHANYMKDPEKREAFVTASFKLVSSLIKSANPTNVRNLIETSKKIHNFTTNKANLNETQQRQLGHNLSKSIGKLVVQLAQAPSAARSTGSNRLSLVKKGALNESIQWIPSLVTTNAGTRKLMTNAMNLALKEHARPIHISKVKKVYHIAKHIQSLPMIAATAMKRPVAGRVVNATIHHGNPMKVMRAFGAVSGITAAHVVAATVRAGLKHHENAEAKSVSAKRALNNLSPRTRAALAARNKSFNYGNLNPRNLPNAERNFLLNIKKAKVLQSFMNS